jgi:hypothetical protein
VLARLTLGVCCLVAACTRREAQEPVARAAEATSAEAALGVGGSGWAVSTDGRVRILGRGVDAVHNHNGPPAHIGSAGFEIHNGRETPLRISVRDIEWLIGSGCQPPLQIKAHPAFAELRRGSVKERAGQSVTVPAKSKLDVEVGYAWQEAYMVYCDRFATRVHFNVEDERIAAVAEHRVVRRTALRRP